MDPKIGLLYPFHTNFCTPSPRVLKPFCATSIALMGPSSFAVTICAFGAAVSYSWFTAVRPIGNAASQCTLAADRCAAVARRAQREQGTVLPSGSLQCPACPDCNCQPCPGCQDKSGTDWAQKLLEAALAFASGIATGVLATLACCCRAIPTGCCCRRRQADDPAAGPPQSQAWQQWEEEARVTEVRRRRRALDNLAVKGKDL